MELEGKAAVVTGASRGIGLATAVALACRGCRVALISRRAAALEAAADRVRASAGEAGRAAGSLRVAVVAADLTREDEVGRAFGEAESLLGGGLDILVNSAGAGRIAPVSTGDPADWRAMWEINVIGLVLCSREALRRFPARGGHIVNLGSMSSHRVPGVGGFYSATKFAVRAMTEAMRIELRRDRNPTRVTMISPGFVDTELVDEYLAPRGQSRADLGYALIPPEEVARAVIHSLEAPDAVEVNDILLRPRDQDS